MAIVQTIEFNSNNDYFAGFLQNIIDQSNILGAVEFSNNTITLTLDDSDTQALTRFSELSNKYLPHSLFLGKIDTNSKDTKIIPSNFTSKPYNIAPCPACLSEITDPASSRYLDDSYICNHYNNEAYIDNDGTFFTPHYTDGCAVLIADSSKIDELFIITTQEKEALFSIEKPTIKATIKSDEIKELTSKNYINIKAPYNTRSSLFALNAKDSDIPYIFFQDTNDLKIVKVQDNTTIIKASRIACELANLDENPIANRFLNISKEADFKLSIGANLSHSSHISFLVTTEVATKEAITFQDFDLEEVLNQMKSDDTKSRLLNNFDNNYPELYQKLTLNNSKNLFETLCIILNIDATDDNAFEALSDKSLEFHGNGGLKVDIEYYEDRVDYSSLIGSVMSFVLAGAETHYIAYSIFEAFGDMTINTLNQLKKKFKIDNIVMMGDMFENSILYSRILSKYQLAKPFFSKSFALDD